MNSLVTARAVTRILTTGLAGALVGGMALAGVAAPAGAATGSTLHVATVAGNGTAGITGTTGPAYDAELSNPTAVAVDTVTGTPDHGDVAVADSTSPFSVRVIAGSTSTQFGKSMTKGDIYSVVPGTQSTGIAFDQAGNLVVANPGGSEVQLVSVSNGAITSIAGTGTPPTTSGEVPATGTPAATAHIQPLAVAVDPTTGNIVFTDPTPFTPAVRVLAETTGTYFGKAVTAGDVYTLTPSLPRYGALTGVAVDPVTGSVVFSLGSGTTGQVVELDSQAAGTFYGVAVTAGTPAVVAGTSGTANTAHTVSGSGEDGVAATTARLNAPKGVAVDAAQNILIADSGDHAVRAVAFATTATPNSLYGVGTSGVTAGNIYTVAGNGTTAPPTQYAAATTSPFGTVTGVAVPSGGQPVLTDATHHELDALGTPAAPSEAPPNPDAAGSSGSALVSWQAIPAPFEGFTAPTHYTVTWYKCSAVGTCTATAAGTKTVTAPGTSTTVQGLTADQLYSFTVTGSNATGTSPTSAPVYTTATASAPGPVSKLAATATSGQMTATWTPPANDGGSAVTGYTATLSPCATACIKTLVTSARTVTFTGLTNGDTYSIAVAATNIAGTGPSTSVTATPAGVPGSPTITKAAPGNGQVTLTWSAPASNGGSTITGYVVKVKKGTTPATTTPTGSTGTSYTVTGLTNGTTYTFSVAAVNAEGTGTFSSAVTAAPVSAPDAPTGVTASSSATGTTVHVTWTVPAANGTTISGYRLAATPVGGGTAVTVTVIGASTTTGTLTGLAKGTTYNVTVAANFTAGTGPASSPAVTVTMASAPGAPVDVVATATPTGSGDISLTWGAPATHGSAITGYTVTVSPACTAACTGTSSTGTSATIGGLTAGHTYTFTVKATNAAGTGPTSAPSNQATSITKPAAPATPTATANTDGTVSLSWTASATNGAIVTKYTVTPSTACSKCTGLVVTGSPAGTTTTISGLTPGQTYSFKVKATNAVGTSATSTSSNTVTPKTAPDAPTGVTASSSATGTKIPVTFTHPATANGTTITGYDVVATPTAGGTPTTLHVTATATLGTITGLTTGATYAVTVAATFTGGKVGPASSPAVTVTMASAPGAPVDVVATATPTGSGDISLTWGAPATHGSAITGYTVTVSPGCTAACTGTSSTGTSATIGGLTAGHTYTFTVKATNAAGTGPTSAPSNQATSITKPAAPATPTATANPDGTVNLTWAEPAGGTHGATITSYTVTPTPACPSCTGLVVRGAPAGTSTTIGGLTLGTKYTFTVKATNIAGTGPTSTKSNTVTPAAVPTAPTNVKATAGITGTAADLTVTWTPATPRGAAITHYTVTVTPATGGAPAATVTVPVPETTVVITTGLSPGTTYNVTVTATNSVGTGPASSPPAQVTTVDVPGAPGDVVATSEITGSGSIQVTWSGAAAHGLTVTSYTVHVHTLTGAIVKTIKVTPAATKTTVPGATLTPGTTYTMTVDATNAYGTGPTSAPSNQAASITKPAKPTTPVATANPDGTVNLTWAEPAGGTHGATITSYTVTPTPACPSCTGLVVRGAPAGTSTTIGGLTLGTKYTFTVKATNIAGTGPTSTKSNTVTPAAVPTAPTNVKATAGITGTAADLTVTWTPATPRGAAITHYTVTVTPLSGGTPVATVTVTAPETTVVITTGLSPGTTYKILVTATNSVGTGPASAPPVTVTTVDVPGAPGDVVATSEITGSGSIQVTWSGAAAHGLTVTSYTVHVHTLTGAIVKTIKVTPAATKTTVPGATLTPGTTYTMTVDATNAYGTGPTSAPSNQAASITKPAKPTTPVATANPDGTVNLTWAEPAGGTHGATITSYTVTPTPACPSCTGLVVRGAPAGTSTTIGGLTLGTKYTFTVKATNIAGTGPTSTKSNTVTPAAVPTAPTNVKATAGITGTAADLTVTWTPATPRGAAITHYTVTVTPLSGGTPVATVTVTAPETTVVITTGLSPGTTYKILVTATNSVGTGPASAPPVTVTTVDVPGAPGDVVATAGVNGTVSLTWGPPAPHGLPLSTYTVTPSPACPSCAGLLVKGSPPSPGTTVSGLTVGTHYTFSVKATNAYGTGPTSAPSNNVLAAGKPGAPTGVTAQPGNASATVTWASPVDNGNPITAYTVTAVSTACGSTCPSTTVTGTTGHPPNTTVTLTGLQNHTTYDVTVTATNAAGTGPASSPAVTVVPAPEPGYWISTSSGGVYAYGGALYYGAAGAYRLNQPVVSMTATPDHKGYWQVAGDGGIFAFGDAGFYGSTGSMHLNKPVVGMAPTGDGHGYWLVAADGGVFAFGDAGFHGSLPGLGVSVNDVVGIVPTADGGGYWMVGADGGVFAFGDAGFHGSLPGLNIAVHDIVDFVPTADGGGYWMVGADGGVFAFGDAGFFGSLGGQPLGSSIAGLAATPSGNGYWLVAQDGYVFTEGDAVYEGSPVGAISGQTVVAIVSSG